MDPNNSHHSRPRVRLRRSHTALPKLGASSNQSLDSQDTKKSHRQHHSHHHIPHPSRRHAKDSSNFQNNGAGRPDSYRPPNRIADHSPSPTANGSRRDSPAGLENSREDKPALPVIIRPEDVAKEHQRGKLRDTELRSSLQALSEQSMKTTRDLDDAYYSILEKVSILQSTISNLRELSSLTAQLHKEFNSEADDFRLEIQQHIDTFGGFRAGKDRIEDMESRVKSSKEKADSLSARLEAARARVLTLEVREAEWQAAISRRLRILWVILGFIAALVIALFLFQTFRQSRHSSDSSTVQSGQSKLPSSTALPSPAKEALHDIFDGLTSPSATSNTSKHVAKNAKTHNNQDTRLRMFDEL